VTETAAISGFDVVQDETAVTSRVEPSDNRAVAINWNVDPVTVGLVTAMAVTVADEVDAGVGDVGFVSVFPAQETKIKAAMSVAAARDNRFIGAPVALPLGNALRTASYSASEMPQLEAQPGDITRGTENLAT
jgi:hypothetical protein